MYICSLPVICWADKSEPELKAIFSCMKNTLFGTQLILVPRMLEITFQGFEISKFPERACLKPLPRGTGLMAPCCYSQVLCSNLLAPSIIIETPEVL